MAGVESDNEIAEATLTDLLARANYLLTERFQEAVKWHGLSLTEWRVLAALSERDGLAMIELAGLVLFKQPTLTKAIDRMERTGLVQRRTPPHDRRRTLVCLTERGRQAVSPLLARARQHEDAVRRDYGEIESRVLISALHTLIGRLSAAPRPDGLRAGAQGAAP